MSNCGIVGTLTDRFARHHTAHVLVSQRSHLFAFFLLLLIAVLRGWWRRRRLPPAALVQRRAVQRHALLVLRFVRWRPAARLNSHTLSALDEHRDTYCTFA